MAISALQLQHIGKEAPGMQDEYDKVRAIFEQMRNSRTVFFDRLNKAR